MSRRQPDLVLLRPRPTVAEHPTPAQQEHLLSR